MKKYLLGLFAVVLAVGFSAFTVAKIEAPKSVNAIFYFQYSPTADFSEAAFETPGNWAQLGSTKPIADPCSGPNNRVCVAHANIADGQVATFITFLTGLPSAQTYLTTPANLDYLKP